MYLRIGKNQKMKCLFKKNLECTCLYLSCNNFSKNTMVKMKLDQLKKLEGNPRKITKEDMERLKKSIKKFGVIE